MSVLVGCGVPVSVVLCPWAPAVALSTPLPQLGFTVRFVCVLYSRFFFVPFSLVNPRACMYLDVSGKVKPAGCDAIGMEKPSGQGEPTHKNDMKLQC